MLTGVRAAMKQVPVIGPMLHHAYLTLFYEEGKLETIREGALKGMKFRRFMHTFWSEYIDGDYEVELQRAFIAMVRPGQVVYDVGANVGFMTMLASKLVGPTGTVISFEPGEMTSRQLRAQIVANHLDNVIVEECAVSDKVGTSEFVVEGISVMARLADLANEDGQKPRTRPVRTTTLDAMLDDHRPPDLVKIDIEGAELLALAGAGRLLAEVRPTLIVELHSEDLSRGFHALMAEKGYSVALPDGTPAELGNFSRFVIARPRADQ